MQPVTTEPLAAVASRTSVVSVQVQSEKLDGKLHLTANALAVVLLARMNRDVCDAQQSAIVARRLTNNGIAVLEIELAKPDESTVADQNFCNIGLFAMRIVTAIQWAARQPEFRQLRLGCMGLGAGGTAALMAAGAFSGSIGALVVADGQPDLVGDRLMNIHAPTLLIAGETHDLHQRMNEIGFARLLCKKELELLRGASADPSVEMNRVAALACSWFLQHLARNNHCKVRAGDTLVFARK